MAIVLEGEVTSLLPAGSRPDAVTLRSAKSEESLSSQASGAGEHRVALHVPKLREEELRPWFHL